MRVPKEIKLTGSSSKSSSKTDCCSGGFFKTVELFNIVPTPPDGRKMRGKLAQSHSVRATRVSRKARGQESFSFNGSEGKETLPDRRRT